MRRLLSAVVTASLLLAPALARAQSLDTQSSPDAQTNSAARPAPEASATNGRSNSVSQSGRLMTPEQLGRQGVVKGVMEQPFRDFNLIRTKIPLVLQRAIADPYERTPQSCEGLRTAVEALNVALGPDLDEPVSTEHPGTLVRVEGVAKNGALDAMRSEVQSQIPFDGFIRMLTGAQRHDKLVMAAIQAGAIRRGYLKGAGEAHGCTVPATPRHLAHPISVATQDGETQSASDGGASRR